MGVDILSLNVGSCWWGCNKSKVSKIEPSSQLCPVHSIGDTGHVWWKLMGSPGWRMAHMASWHPHRRGGLRALGPWNLRAAWAGPWAGPGAADGALDAVHSGARPDGTRWDGMVVDGGGWWWMVLLSVFSMFFHGFFWNLMVDDGVFSMSFPCFLHGRWSCGTTPRRPWKPSKRWWSLPCGSPSKQPWNRPYETWKNDLRKPRKTRPRKKKVKSHHPEVRSSSHPNKMGLDLL